MIHHISLHHDNCTGLYLGLLQSQAQYTTYVHDASCQPKARVTCLLLGSLPYGASQPARLRVLSHHEAPGGALVGMSASAGFDDPKLARSVLDADLIVAKLPRLLQEMAGI